MLASDPGTRPSGWGLALPVAAVWPWAVPYLSESALTRVNRDHGALASRSSQKD